MLPRCFSIVLALACAAPTARAQESAVDSARAAARAHPGDAASSIALGRALRRAGHYAESIAELRRGAASLAAHQPDAAIELHVELARAFIAQRDFPQAMVACRVAMAQTGGAAEGHACAAEADLLWRRATDALTELQQAGHTFDAKVAEGRALALQLKDAQAEAAFRDAMTLEPSRAEPHLYLGTYWATTGKPDQGLAELKRAVELDGTNPDALYELGRALPAGPDAIAALEKATHERPGFLEAWAKLAEVDLALGKNENARAAAASALRLNGQDASAHVVVGRVALADGKIDDAIREARAALGVLATSSPAKLLLADAYAQKGDIDLALEQYQAAYGLESAEPRRTRARRARVREGRAAHERARLRGDGHPRFPDLGPRLRSARRRARRRRRPGRRTHRVRQSSPRPRPRRRGGGPRQAHDPSRSMTAARTSYDAPAR